MLNWLFTGDPCAYQNRKTEAQRGRGRTSDSSGSAEEGARADVKGREEKRAGGKGEGGGRYVGFLRSTCDIGIALLWPKPEQTRFCPRSKLLLAISI